MPLKKFLTCLSLVLLAGCGGLNDRVSVNEPTLEGRVRIGVSSLEIKEPSLPGYAVADEISIEGEGGLLVTEGSVLWADKPSRAIALELTRHLTGLTGTRIASSPWPFEEPPAGTLDLRFKSFVARADGTFFVSGQYFLGRLDGGRERSGLFELVEPIGEPLDSTNIAKARGRAVANLARFLANNALK